MQQLENAERNDSAVAFQKLINESRRPDFSFTPDDHARFFELLLVYGIERSTSHGAAAWRFDDTGLVPAVARGFVDSDQFPDTVQRELHRLFVAATAATGQNRRVSPGESAAGVEFGNPFDRPVVVVPLAVLGKLVGVLEFIEHEDEPRGDDTVAPIFSFLRQQAEEFLLRSRVAEQSKNERTAEALNRLSLSVHASLEVRRIAYAAANEICEQLVCDRVGVAIYRRSKCRMTAVSGQDRFDSRSSVVRILERLATLAAKTGEPIYCDETVGEVAPEVQQVLYEYLEETHAKQLAVVPIKRKEEAKSGPVQHVVGVLLVERLSTSLPLVGWTARLDRIAVHVGSAIGAGLESEWPVFESIGGVIRRSPLRRAFRNIRLSLVIAAVALAIIGTLVFYPADFALHAPGKLQPVMRREVFAAIDGTVRRVHVRHGQAVTQGMLLAELVNHDLDVAEAELLKQIKETEQEVVNTERELNDAQRSSAIDRGKITARRATAVQRLQGMRAQEAIYREKRRRLKVYSPIDGRVTTWNVEELLMLRPVQQGHLLLSIVDPTGDWELEVRLPEQRLGHVLAARNESRADLPVSFIVAADPYHERNGRIRDVHLAADVRDDEEGNTVLIKADLEDKNIPGLNSGGEVRAKVHCGTKPLGYVWLHDIYEFLETQVFFRL
jgi:multidrug efflux pump subunit AcrA (membrane-fusion protein)